MTHKWKIIIQNSLNKRCYNNTGYHSPLITILSITVWNFAWVLRVINSLPGLTLRGFYTLGVCFAIWLTPLFFEEHILMLWLSVPVSWIIIFQGGYKAIPLQMVRVLFWWVGVFHVREVDRCCLWFLLTCRVLTCFTPPYFVWPCLPWPSSMSGHFHHQVHYLLASTGSNIAPSVLCMCSSKVYSHFTCLWWTLQ